jgi:hypothetical protein
VGFGLFSNSFGLFSDSLCKDPVAEKEPNQKEAASKSQDKAPSNEPKPKPEEQKPPSAPEQKQKKKKKDDSHKEPAPEGKISVVKPRFGKAPPT